MEVTTFYIHKYRIRLEYGGPEEGGWWFKSGIPAREHGQPVAVFTGPRAEEEAIDYCYELNQKERERRDNEEDYSYHSVFAYRSKHFEYDVSENPRAEAFPTERPHYE